MKTAAAVIFILLGISGICLLFFIPQKAEGPALERLVWDDLDISSGLQDRKLVLSGIEKSITILGALKEEEVAISGVPVSRRGLLAGLESMKAIFSQDVSNRKCLAEIRKEFLPWEIRESKKEKPVLATGYFQPAFKGSLNATEEYSSPVYGWPPDLLRVSLKRFDNCLPSRTIWGRVSGRQLVPYYSRREIETKDLLPAETVLCWLSSPVDVLELQIQGSGIIGFPDGSSRFIHYAASNGLAYKSIGKVLKERGILPPERLDWPGIKQWARDNPEEFQRIAFENPRYVFFRWEDRGPVGSYGRVLVPGTSAALDRSVYPPALPAFLKVDWPEIKNGPDWFRARPATLMVFNHDRGSAIKGPFRIDLYCGTGEQAGNLAGRLKSPARLILLLPKDMEIGRD